MLVLKIHTHGGTTAADYQIKFRPWVFESKFDLGSSARYTYVVYIKLKPGNVRFGFLSRSSIFMYIEHTQY